MAHGFKTHIALHGLKFFLTRAGGGVVYNVYQITEDRVQIASYNGGLDES